MGFGAPLRVPYALDIVSHCRSGERIGQPHVVPLAPPPPRARELRRFSERLRARPLPRFGGGQQKALNIVLNLRG